MTDEMKNFLHSLKDRVGQSVPLELRWGADARLHDRVMTLAVSVCASRAMKNGTAISDEELIETASQVYRNFIGDLEAQLEYRDPTDVLCSGKIVVRIPPLRCDASRQEAE